MQERKKRLAKGLSAASRSGGYRNVTPLTDDQLRRIVLNIEKPRSQFTLSGGIRSDLIERDGAE
jgi:hypothetical protein